MTTEGTQRTAKRTHGFTESVIRGMTRVATEANAINLAQGFPNFPAPDVLKTGAIEAIRSDINQYAVTWGTPRLRHALAGKYLDWYGVTVDPDRELTVCCGATEAMVATLMAVVDPGDEVIVFEPFYENYGPDAILCGASPVFVTMPSTGPLDLEAVAAAFNHRTRAIIINTPNNPGGRVLTEEELIAIGELCQRYDAYAITDEIYEHILYDGKHIPMMTLPGMRDRTITISGASKTFSVTGWRIGTVLAPPDLSDAIRKVHDFLTVGAPAPLQEGVAAALETLDESYYTELSAGYRARRDLLYGGLIDAGFKCDAPSGAYYILADITGLTADSDVDFALWMTREIGVATVPGSSFYNRPEDGSKLTRFAFCKTEEMLAAAVSRLARING